MPFAHCLDCGTSALVDPSGRCPEGHVVGAAGARVTAAIGSATPHPDEPQPWVRQVELDPAALDAARPAPRVARPLSVPTSQEPVRSDHAAVSAVAEDLLRELHALGDLGGAPSPRPTATVSSPTVPPTPAARPVARPAAVPPAPAVERSTLPTEALPAPIAPVTPAAAPPITPVAPAAAAPTAPSTPSAPAPSAPAPSAPAPSSPAPPSSPEEATDLDELASLAAAVRSFDDRGGAPARRDLFDVLDATDELPRPTVAATPEPARPAPRPAPAPAPAAAAPAVHEGDDLRRDALADVAELARYDAMVAADDPAVTDSEHVPAPAAPQLDGLTFTAKGPKGARPEKRGGRSARRGLFRR